MTRFTQQLGEYDCGPTAVANAVKWSGGRISYQKHHREIKAACDFDVEEGSSLRDFDQALRTYGKIHFVTRNRFNRPNLQEIESHLANGGAIVIGYWPPLSRAGGDDYPHLCVLTRVSATGQSFWAANLDNKTVKRISRNRMRGMMRDRDALRCWLLTKKG